MAIQTAPNSKPGSLFFTDARTCKEWLKSIPLTNIAQAQQNILDSLRVLNRSPEFVALERLTCMELMRDKVAFLLTEQRARYAGKTIPLAHGDNAAWMVSRTLLTEMESGYRRCWTDAAGEDSPLATHAALIVQRIMRYIGLQMLIAGFIYRRFDPALWMRLHLLHDLARGEVAIEAGLAGGAEAAGHGTAGLGRHAHGGPVGVPHQHGLHLAAVSQGPQPLHRVAGIAHRLGGQPQRRRQQSAHRGPQRLGQGGPLLGFGALVVEPLPHLVHPVARLAVEQVGELRAGPVVAGPHHVAHGVGLGLRIRYRGDGHGVAPPVSGAVYTRRRAWTVNPRRS